MGSGVPGQGKGDTPVHSTTGKRIGTKPATGLPHPPRAERRADLQSPSAPPISPSPSSLMKSEASES